MKRNALTAAVVAGVAGAAGLANVATAVNINPDGLGQVLVYPYYTVRNDQATLVSVVNTTDETKAVKVRFLEALNSREVLDFNLYLSPFDVWTGAIVATANGAQLQVTDTSCTVPGIETQPDQAEDFRNFAYIAGANDDGPDGLDRTREGHIEMIEMGVVVDNGDNVGSAYPLPGAPGNLNGVDNVVEQVPAFAGGPLQPRGTRFATAATHDAGRPISCATLVAAWSQGGIWAANGTVDIDEPSGGLFGAASIVNVANGTNVEYNADAVDGFRLVADSGALHTQPGSLQPNLTQAQTSLDPTDLVQSIVFDSGTLINSFWPRGFANAVSAVFMHDALYNEYATEGDFVQSEWVITFPTKRFHIEGPTGTLSAAAANGYLTRRPFTDNVDDSDTSGDPDGNPAGDRIGDTSVFDPGGSCEPMDVLNFDREEGPEGVVPPIDFSPPPPVTEAPGLNLCWESNVLTFNQSEAVTAGASRVLGSTIARNLELVDAGGNRIPYGWLRLGLGDGDNFMIEGALGTDGLQRDRYFGLPATGFWAANFVNANAAPGTLANYSVTHKHRSSRDIDNVNVSYDVDGVETITPSGFAAS